MEAADLGCAPGRSDREAVAGAARPPEEEFVLADGRVVGVRELAPGDAEALRGMLGRLSREAIHRRFHLPLRRVPEWAFELLARADRPDGVSLVAVSGGRIVAHAMCVEEPEGNGREAEVALVVEDTWQSGGLGKALLRALASRAAERGIGAFTCLSLGEDRRVLGLARAMFGKLAFSAKGGGTCLLRMPLRRLRPAPSDAPGFAEWGGVLVEPREGVEVSWRP